VVEPAGDQRKLDVTTPAKAAIVNVRVGDLPQWTRLYSATHCVLVERLMPPHEISIQAWNELLAAHDDLAEGRLSE